MVKDRKVCERWYVSVYVCMHACMHVCMYVRAASTLIFSHERIGTWPQFTVACLVLVWCNHVLMFYFLFLFPILSLLHTAYQSFRNEIVYLLVWSCLIYIIVMWCVVAVWVRDMCHRCHNCPAKWRRMSPLPCLARKCHAKKPAQKHKCHACHAKWRWMSPIATPATQSDARSRQVPCLPCKTPRRPRAVSATLATQSDAGCRQVPGLPRKEQRRPRRQLGTRCTTRAGPVP